MITKFQKNEVMDDGYCVHLFQEHPMYLLQRMNGTRTTYRGTGTCTCTCTFTSV